MVVVGAFFKEREYRGVTNGGFIYKEPLGYECSKLVHLFEKLPET